MTGHLRSAWRWTCFAGAIVMVFMLGGCDASRLQFVQDDRVEIVEPKHRSSVTIPVTVRWEVNGFSVTGRNDEKTSDAGYFAVFVDRTPIPPGRTLEWYAQQNESCGGSPCDTVDNLADIYTTEDVSLKLTRLPAVSERGGVEEHEVVVVLMDGTGARIGESAFYVRFSFEREA